MPKPKQDFDALFENHGSIWLVRPLTLAASCWLTNHTEEDAQRFGGATVVEPCYVAALAAGMMDAGLRVR